MNCYLLFISPVQVASSQGSFQSINKTYFPLLLLSNHLSFFFHNFFFLFHFQSPSSLFLFYSPLSTSLSHAYLTSISPHYHPTHINSFQQSLNISLFPTHLLLLTLLLNIHIMIYLIIILYICSTDGDESIVGTGISPSFYLYFLISFSSLSSFQYHPSL